MTHPNSNLSRFSDGSSRLAFEHCCVGVCHARRKGHGIQQLEEREEELELSVFLKANEYSVKLSTRLFSC